MNTQLTKKLLSLFLLLFSTYVFSQEGNVSGILKDNSGVPIPGVNISIKGTNIGTTTDFDGDYSITCKVGDILVFNYIGFSSKEVIVTASMFGSEFKTPFVENISIYPIKSNAYKNAINNIEKTTKTIPSIEQTKLIHNITSYLQYNRIKDIDITKNQVKLTYFNPDVFYEIGYKSINGFQFVKNSNLPELQTTFSQGRSSLFEGPETGNVFSYGPKISNLEFDGSNYEYDTNGKLVALGNGNANRAKTYNNKLFNTSLNSSHNVFFNISTNTTFLGFDYTNKTQSDLYNIEKSRSNDLILKYKNNVHSNKKLSWDTYIKYSNHINNQPNINGFQNNLLLNQWVTPVTFNNNEGYTLADNTLRSFSPNTFNNPNGLLNNNKNSEKNTAFIASLQNEFKVSNDIKLNSNLNYTNFKNTQNFGVAKNTIGFENGYLSHRHLNKNTFNGILNFKYNKNNDGKDIDVISVSNYTHENLKYVLNQTSGFEDFSFNNPRNGSFINNTLQRNTLRLLNKLTYKFNESGLDISASNNSYISSIQNNKWFLPTLQFRLDFDELIDIYGFRKLTISASTSFDVNDTSLLYNNRSHNSLNINPSESLQYLATNDLFLNASIKLEEKESYDLTTTANFYVFNTYFNVLLTHFNTKTKNAVFPIFENNAFQLKNVADIVNKGFEAELSTNIRLGNDSYYYPTITFATNRTKVLKLLNDTERIPIAGFSSTSKNLIVGESAGVIVGSTYARDTNNNIIIDDNGFPIVDNESKIIGDPTPGFNLGFSNNFTLKNFSLNVVIDVQKGGDVWNGTQNVLNYFGTSQQSATERHITNFIFNGVNQQGDTNTIPVDFYNPENSIAENKFVRYGFEGVAEDAIVDGSYINLKSINLSYQVMKNERDKFIRDLEVGVYANNLITWSKFNGASPYSSLYGNSAGHGLNFFNAPILSEVGFKINVKI